MSRYPDFEDIASGPWALTIQNDTGAGLASGWFFDRPAQPFEV
jgi:hypothetical protein